MIEVKFKGKKPQYMTKGAMCFDIESSEDSEWESVKFADVSVNTVIVKTGLFVEIPEGYGMNIYPRSGWGFKYNIQLANGTGKIDSDYRGEILVKLYNIGNKDELPKIEKGTRVAQGEIVEVKKANFKKADALNETSRGEGGFGSTGH